MKLIRGIISTFLLLIWMFSTGCPTVHGKAIDKSKNKIEIRMNQEELHNAVTSFADRFMSTIGNAAYALESEGAIVHFMNDLSK